MVTISHGPGLRIIAPESLPHQLLLEVESRPGRFERDNVINDAEKVGGAACDGLEPRPMPVPGPDRT